MEKKFTNRKHERIQSLNLLHYVCMDDSDQIVNQGMGRTLNVSEGGILLETYLQIDMGYTILLDIGFEEEMISLTGKVAHTKKGNQGMFEAGIQFKEIKKNALKLLQKYIAAFNAQKKGKP